MIILVENGFTKLSLALIIPFAIMVYKFFPINEYKKYEKETNLNEYIQKVYFDELVHLEEKYEFGSFYLKYSPDYFKADPMVLLLGQYSSGKTTSIRYFLKEGYEGMEIGPHPTTDKFHIIMHGNPVEKKIPGNLLVQKSSLQEFKHFGDGFINNNFDGSFVSNEYLRNLTFIDSPGILAGDQMANYRGYDYVGVFEQFGEISDLILLFFEPNKLDFSEDLTKILTLFKRHKDKMKIILNKAHDLSNIELQEVTNYLMWQMGKVIDAPEMKKTFICSFKENVTYFDSERENLIKKNEKIFEKDIERLKNNGVARKVNDLIKRIRLLKIIAVILDDMFKRKPYFYVENFRGNFIEDLPNVYRKISQQYNFALDAFPNIENVKKKLATFNLNKLKPFDLKDDKILNDMIESLSERIRSHFFPKI